MHLTPREHERLLIAAGADLARRRIARGSLLGAVEAIALVCDEIIEMAWDDTPHQQVIARARRVVPRDSLLPGVAALVPSVQVEALFPYGSVLVHVDDPLGPLDGDPHVDGPGAVRPGRERIALAPGRRRASAVLSNGGHAPIWVSSHVPLDTLNPALTVQAPAGRWRLDLPAGMSRRIEPGERAQLGVVQIQDSRDGHRERQHGTPDADRPNTGVAT